MKWPIVSIIVVVLAIVVLIFHNILRLKPRYPLHFGGFVENGFESVFEAFKENFKRGYDNEGSSFAVCHRNRIVVNIWGGYSDYENRKVWNQDTLTIAYSTTKAVCAICLALIVDRGLVNYDDLVVNYWPEFGKHGKDNVTIRMLASHQAGLAVFDESITYDLMRDPKRMSQIIENQKPNWQPNDKVAGYHMATYGFLIDQLIRRIDEKHRSLGNFFREEIAEPYNLDFYIGLPQQHLGRVAKVNLPSWFEWFHDLSEYRFLLVLWATYFRSSDSLLDKAMKNPPFLLYNGTGGTAFNDPELQQIEFGAALGIGNAKSLAELMCLLASGKLISRKTLDAIRRPVIEKQEDLVILIPMTYGHGFELYKYFNDDNYVLGHSGYGGQNAKSDPEFEIGFAYLRNGLSHLAGEISWSYKNLKNATYSSLLSKKNL